MSAAAKYLHVLSIGVQNTLVYRFNFFARALIGLIPLTATLSLWRAIYAGKETDATIAAYTLAQMTSYYLLVTVVDACTAVAEDDWQVAADIKDGNISQFLLKPIDYLWYRLCLYLSGRCVYTAVALVPVVTFIAFQREYFVLPNSVSTLVFFVVTTALAALLQFFIAYVVALLAFWVLDVSTFIFIQFALEYLASGHLFPLDILPPALTKALFLTPYPYLVHFPVSIYLGRIQGSQLWLGLAMELAWLVILFGFARWTWRRGIRHYSAAGG